MDSNPSHKERIFLFDPLEEYSLQSPSVSHSMSSFAPSAAASPAPSARRPGALEPSLLRDTPATQPEHRPRTRSSEDRAQPRTCHALEAPPPPREPTPARLLSEDDLPSPGRARANPLLLCLNLFVSAPVHPLIRASTCQALITCAGYRGHRRNNIHEVPLPTLARQRGQEAHT